MGLEFKLGSEILRTVVVREFSEILITSSFSSGTYASCKPPNRTAFSAICSNFESSIDNSFNVIGILQSLKNFSVFQKEPSAFIQDRFAEGLLKTCIKYCPIALKEPENYDARANLMWASTMALNGLTGCGKAGVPRISIIKSSSCNYLCRINRTSSSNSKNHWFGKGQIESLAQILKPFGTRVLLVYGGGSMKKKKLKCYIYIRAQRRFHHQVHPRLPSRSRSYPFHRTGQGIGNECSSAPFRLPALPDRPLSVR